MFLFYCSSDKILGEFRILELVCIRFISKYESLAARSLTDFLKIKNLASTFFILPEVRFGGGLNS